MGDNKPDIETGADTLLSFLEEKRKHSVSKIADDLGVPEDTIKSWAKALEKSGYVDIKYSAIKGMVLEYSSDKTYEELNEGRSELAFEPDELEIEAEEITAVEGGNISSTKHVEPEDNEMTAQERRHTKTEKYKVKGNSPSSEKKDKQVEKKEEDPKTEERKGKDEAQDTNREESVGEDRQETKSEEVLESDKSEISTEKSEKEENEGVEEDETSGDDKEGGKPENDFSEKDLSEVGDKKGKDILKQEMKKLDDLKNKGKKKMKLKTAQAKLKTPTKKQEDGEDKSKISEKEETETAPVESSSVKNKLKDMEDSSEKEEANENVGDFEEKKDDIATEKDVSEKELEENLKKFEEEFGDEQVEAPDFNETISNVQSLGNRLRHEKRQNEHVYHDLNNALGQIKQGLKKKDRIGDEERRMIAETMEILEKDIEEAEESEKPGFFQNIFDTVKEVFNK